MFSGIVEAMGVVRRVERCGGLVRMTVDGNAVGRSLGVRDSICVSGACLTVTGKRGALFTVDMVPETLARTIMGSLRQGSRVNLERSVRADQVLGGHIVLGHVDGVGKVTMRRAEGGGVRMRIRPPRELARYIAYKGSVSVDGVSLTVAAAGRTDFEVALIPFTLAHTTLGGNRRGDRVNLEADMIAKYVERLLEFRRKR